MRRGMLIAAMVFSLWPIAGAAAWIALVEPPEEESTRSAAPSSGSNSSTDTSSSSTRSEEGGDSGGSGEEAIYGLARSEIKDLQRELRSLTNRVSSVSIEEGVAKPGIEVEADYLKEGIDDWLSTYSSFVSNKERTVIKAMRKIASTLEAMAANPTETTFDAFNDAVDDYNAVID